MAEIKWIKLNIDMFDNRKIKQIRKYPGGNEIILFWVMLLNLAGKCNAQGHILFTENIAYTPEMLATECDIELNTINMALEIFCKFNMITMHNEVISITGWAEYQNVEGMERAKLLTNQRVKKYRENKKKLLEAAKEEASFGNCNVTETLHETQCNSKLTHTEIDREIDKEEEIDISSKLDIRESLKSIEQAYFNTFYRQMTPIYVQKVLEILEKGDYTNLIVHAIEITKLRSQQQGNEKGFRYALSILETWINKGYTTVDDVNKNEGSNKSETENKSNSAAYKPFEYEN